MSNGRDIDIGTNADADPITGDGTYTSTRPFTGGEGAFIVEGVPDGATVTWQGLFENCSAYVNLSGGAFADVAEARAFGRLPPFRPRIVVSGSGASTSVRGRIRT